MTGGDTGPRETDRHGMMEAEPGVPQAERGSGKRWEDPAWSLQWCLVLPIR